LVFRCIEIGRYRRIESIIKEMDVKRNSKTIGKQAKLVEITEMTVDKIQFNIGITRRLFRHILVSSGVGIKVIVVYYLGKCFLLVDFTDQGFRVAFFDFRL